MSYDIYFIKRKDLNKKNIQKLLENDAQKTDIHFVSKKEMIEIKDLLLKKGLKFEVFEEKEEDYTELNFPTYQIMMFNNQFAFSLPYWDQNSSEGINNEIKEITNLLIERGFTGYDPQTEKFIKTKYEISDSFKTTKTTIYKNVNKEGTNKMDLSYVGILIAIVVIAMIIRKIIR